MPPAERLRLWPVVGLATLGLLLTGGTVLAFTLAAGNREATGIVISVVTAIVTPLISGLVAVLWRQRRLHGHDDADSLALAADALAKALREQWEDAATDRRLYRPAPIPVRWVWSTRPVTGRLQDAVADPEGLSLGRFEPLPGTDTVTADMIEAGGLAQLFRIYAGLSSGRLVILGDPGAGKTAAAILTLVEALHHRLRLDPDVRRPVPVPVLLTPQSWEPQRQTLRNWLVGRLASEFAFLNAPKYGPDAAARLVDEGLIALFLDGFDEMAPESRASALESIDEQANFRLVLLTRSEEFTEAVRTGHLHDAAALELRPLPAAVTADYLARWLVNAPPPAWRRLLARLREQPDSPLAHALSSPLTVTLLRDTFVDAAEVDELLAPERFRDATEIEDFLLDRVLPAAYRPRPGRPVGPYDLVRARRWLGHAAAQMSSHNTRDLAWWRMHQWASAPVRILATLLFVGLAAGATAAVVARFTEELGERSTMDPLPATVVGLVLGLAIGLAVERRESPVGGFSGSAGSRFSLGMGLVSGLAVGIATVLTVGPSFGAVTALTVSLGAALAAGIATGIASGIGIKPTGSALAPQSGLGRTIRAGLTHGLPAGLATGVPIGLATGVPVGLAYGMPTGLGTGLVIGLAFVLAFGLIDGFSAASLDVAAPIDPITAWQQDRRRGLSVGAIFGLVVGFAAGFTDAMATGRHDPLPVAAGVGIITGLTLGLATAVAATITVSSTWRTGLLFLQLWARGDGPVRGMRFLENAHQREILRVVGSVYQFRHARLQDRLTQTRQR
ncbi:hypothetical protein AB0J90_10835 [Micromonospora sp. NPDC049523]|uniref:hypothetical protein n=1 Tax=Micromonospora sp. NPDC049523 TaxID=3155921 RepID=UPI0034342E6A